MLQKIASRKSAALRQGVFLACVSLGQQKLPGVPRVPLAKVRTLATFACWGCVGVK
jgi:hypothetical protein